MIARTLLAGFGLAAAVAPALALDLQRDRLDALIASHAKTHGLPEDLVHRVVKRESRYNPNARGRGGVLGLMQIKHGTARAMGYTGSAAGLLDPDTNLAYGVKYLAGAYEVAGGDANRAVAYFARGYYYAAKRKGLAELAGGKRKRRGREPEPEITTSIPATVAQAETKRPLFTSGAAFLDNRDAPN